METEQILRSCECGVCSLPIGNEGTINMVSIPRKPTWDYPRMGNILTNEEEKACTVVHDQCLGKDVIFALELDGEKVYYHPVEELELLDP